MITNDPDFTATLRYLKKEEGGRSNPVFSGYFPLVRFAFSEILTGGKQKFLDKEVVYPGETVEVEIKLISAILYQNQLEPGMQFEITENGRTTIATGTIKEILNVSLRKD